MYKKLLILLFVLTSVTSLADTALDDGVKLCGVPVCNFKATKEALETISQNSRYNYANKMIASYKTTENILILKNLLQIAKELNVLSTKLQDEDWVIRESETLINNMIINLSKYSEVDSNILFNYFKQITDPNKRYEILNVWNHKLEDIENAKDIDELIIFAKRAAKYSRSLKDADWISREADSIIAKSSLKLTYLDPIHEGLFSVTINHRSRNRGFLPFDKIAVLDSSSEKNIIVVFFNSKYSMNSFFFSSAELSGDTISGKLLTNNNTSAKFEINLNRKTGRVVGFVNTNDTLLKFSGKQIFSTGEVFKGSVPQVLNKDDVLGTFKGVISGVEGEITISSFEANTYNATFRSFSGSVKIDFLGKFYMKQGVLSFTHNNMLKLMMSLRKVNNKIAWRGYMYSTRNTKISKVKFDFE